MRHTDGKETTMKSFLYLLLTLNMVSISAFAAERKCMSMSERTTSSPAESNNVKVAGVSPPAGTTVHKWNTLTVDLDYDVKDFDSASYILVAEFDTTKEGRSTDGSFTFSKYPHLIYARGSFRLCFPLKDVWTDPNVKRPFSVRFFLSQMDNPHHFHPVAKTEPLIFPAG
jgi:hypothetical protein